MDVWAKRGELKIAESKAVDAWLANTNFGTLVAMDKASKAVKEFDAVNGTATVRLSEKALNGIMDRSVFGTVDKIRAARTA